MLVLCSAPRYRLHFFLFVDKRLDDSINSGVDDLFLEHPSAREQKHDIGPEQCQLFFVSQGSVFLTAQSFDLWTFCKMTSLRLSFIIGFLAREASPGC